MKVVTCNLWAHPLHREARLIEVARILGEHSLDVIAFQEVSRGSFPLIHFLHLDAA